MCVAGPAEQMATYADLLALPDDVRAEVLGGQVTTAPAPLPRHARAQRSLGHYIGGPFDDDDGVGGPGGWWIFVEVDIELGTHDVVRPDLSGWRRERLPRPGSERPIHVTPDWVCEVLSPSTAMLDRGPKRDLYHQHGIPWYWLVDTEARLVEVFRRTEPEGWQLVGAFGDGQTSAMPPFEAIEVPIGRLFLPRDADGASD